MTTKRPKKIAKKLKRAANASGIQLRLSKAQQAVARMYGYAHWHELHSALGSHPPSPMDGDVADEEVTARRAYQSNVLAAELAIDLDIAAAIVDAVPPTGPSRRTGLVPDGDWEDEIEQEGKRYW